MRTTILLTLLPGLLAGCAAPGPASPSPKAISPGAPSWLESPYQHVKVRQAFKIAGVGQAPGLDADAADAARLRGMAEITSQIKVEVASQIEMASTSRTGSEDSFWEEGIKESVTLNAQGELPGAEVVETWRDRQAGTTYVLVTVEREFLLDQLLPGVEQANTSAAELLSGDSGDPVRALLNAIQAYGVVTASFADAGEAKVVASRSPFAKRAVEAFDRGVVLLGAASERLAAMTQSMRVTKLSGDGQQGAVAGSLADPLVAQFTLVDPTSGRAAPLAGLPVHFRAEGPAQPSFASSSSSTDAQGRIRCQVSDLPATGRASNQIVVEPDLAELAPSLPMGRLPHESFVYSLPTPGQTAIVVAITSRFGDQPLAHSGVSENVAGHLSEFGFDVTSREDLAELDTSALAQAVGPNVRYVISGHADAWFSSREGPAFWFIAQARLEIVELATGRVQSLATPESKSIYTDSSSRGAVKALRGLARPLGRALDEEFVSRFAPVDGSDG